MKGKLFYRKRTAHDGIHALKVFEGVRGNRSLPHGKLHALALRTVQVLSSESFPGRTLRPLQFRWGMGIRWETSWKKFPTPFKNFQNMYCLLFGALFCHIFALIFPEEPALLMPKTAETPSRGPLAPLYGGKGSARRGVGEL